jgi:hypothetical protein
MSNRLERAADALDRIGRYHGWWKSEVPSWRELDAIKREEFLDIVFEILQAGAPTTPTNTSK